MNQLTSLNNLHLKHLRGQVILGGVLLCFLMIGSALVTKAAEPTDTGYRDYAYGSIVNSAPTREKPESKLWWNDGFWWGSLWSPTANAFHIYRLDLTTQTWADTGTTIDTRSNSKADALWDGQHLYVTSHLWTTLGQPSSSPSTWGRLYRYSYNPNTDTYTLDSGFPVTITKGKSETLVIAKDSTGMLWVTYVESQQVMMNHSLSGNDLNWVTPYVLPVAGATGLTGDDIASVVAFHGRIGVMWSNQNTQAMYFAVHQDSDPNDQNWQSIPAYNPGGSGADDHINLKSLLTDGNGHVFAVTKTSFTASSDPLILLLTCTAEGCATADGWQVYTVYQVQDGQTRPILLIDTDNRDLHVFSASPESGGAIYHKSSDLDNIQFPTGAGTPFIQSSADPNINHPTSTRQNVNGETGIVVLASDHDTTYYLHNYLDLSEGNPPPAILNFSPTDDAYVRSSTPTQNYGSQNSLRLRSGSQTFHSYLKFNVAGLGGTVQSAKVRLFVTDGGNDGGSIYLVDNSYLDTNTPWDESGLTWNNAPQMSGAALDTVGVVSVGQWVEFDVTAVLSGDGIYSFALLNNSANGVAYRSSEATINQPVLVVETIP